MKMLPPKPIDMPTGGAAGIFLTRSELAHRWLCSISTLKRREQDGSLVATRLGPRMVRYPLEAILAIEASR